MIAYNGELGLKPFIKSNADGCKGAALRPSTQAAHDRAFGKNSPIRSIARRMFSSELA